MPRKQQKHSMTAAEAKGFGIVWDEATIRRIRAERDAPRVDEPRKVAPDADRILVSDGRRLVFAQAHRARVDDESLQRLDEMFGEKHPWGLGWGRF